MEDSGLTTWAVSPFFNELDVLEVKLATLDGLVDRWVLAEATTDQRGNPKPLYLKEAQERGELDRFAPWIEKVSYVVVDDTPAGQEEGTTAAHWRRENHQRNALIRGLDDLADDDVVLISDLDEVPYPAALEEGIAEPGLRFPMDMHVYRLDWRWEERPVRDGSTAVTRTGAYVRARGVHRALLDADGARWRTRPRDGYHASSGWHLAYMYDRAGIAAKVRAIADDGWAQLVPDDKKGRPEWWPTPDGPSDALLDRCVAEGVDVFGRDHRQAERVALDQLPPYVAESRDRFAHLLLP